MKRQSTAGFRIQVLVPSCIAADGPLHLPGESATHPIEPRCGALVERAEVQAWRFPQGMECRVIDFDPRPGGAIEVDLRYDDAAATGKTAASVDHYRGRFVEIAANTRVVEEDEFVTADPMLPVTKRITIELFDDAAPGVASTRVVAVHEGLPPGLCAADDNETGWAMALERLAKRCEAGAPG